MKGVKAIREALAAHKGDIASFVNRLDREGVPYLSYSKIASVEFCPYRYCLEYVQRVKLRPEPAYFVKGRTFHKAAAVLYQGLARGSAIRDSALERLIRKHDDEAEQQHLRNAVALLRENALVDWRVVGVERPFALSVARDLPPCIGVVDLILRRDGTYAVIDHKTGRNLGGGDAMQLAIYRQHVLRRRQESSASPCSTNIGGSMTFSASASRRSSERRSACARRPGTASSGDSEGGTGGSDGSRPGKTPPAPGRATCVRSVTSAARRRIRYTPGAERNGWSGDRTG